MLTLRRKEDFGEAFRTTVSHTKMHKTLQVPVPGSLGPVTPEEACLLEKLDLTRLPRHVAVIMDGNGRWAQKRHLPRIAGHRSGTQSARTTIETCARLKIEALTLYAFSVENWRRPKAEIDFLMQLLREYLRKEMPLIQKNEIRMRFLGRIGELPSGVQKDVREAMEKTAGNQGMVLCVALNYGGRAEIVDAMNAILEERNGHGSAERISEEQLARYLYTSSPRRSGRTSTARDCWRPCSNFRNASAVMGASAKAKLLSRSQRVRRVIDSASLVAPPRSLFACCVIYSTRYDEMKPVLSRGIPLL